MDHEAVKLATAKWLQTVVIDLNLCPFAQRNYQAHRMEVSDASTEKQLLQSLLSELILLRERPEIETSLLISPNVLQDFTNYNQFLSMADSLLAEMAFEGVFQIASFHPDYQFADTRVDSVENFTNRSPYPMLHILREASLEIAIRHYPGVAQIPQDNVEKMKKLGSNHMQQLLKACYVVDVG